MAPQDSPIQCIFRFEHEYDDRDKNSLNSPRFPEDYFANTNCIYEIKAPEGYRILIEFEQFDLHGPQAGGVP